MSCFQVESELSDLVRVLTLIVPRLHSVRVFGSYGSDRWNPEKSDIDVAVVTGDETYSIDDLTPPLYNGFNYVQREGSNRSKLRKDIRDQLRGDYKDRFELCLCSKRDIWTRLMVNDGRGYMGLAMMRGRLLYGPKNIFDYLELARNLLGGNSNGLS